jgi:hypothetical protein
VKLIGAGIASTLYFLPFQINYSDNLFSIETSLNAPMTSDIEQLIKKAYRFQIHYSFTIIINDKRTYSADKINSVGFHQKWQVNDSDVVYENVQKKLGHFSTQFNHFNFDEGDKLFIFVNAHILPDDNFTQSTGFQPGILWSYYVPRAQETYFYKNGAFVKQ